MEKKGGNVGRHLIPRCKTLRIDAKQRISGLARLADVDRSVVSKIERNHTVTEVTAKKVFDALNELHKGRLAYRLEVIVVK